MTLGKWSGWRVAMLSLGWLVFLVALTIARATLAGRAYQRAHPGTDGYLIGYAIPGGLWAMAAPPLVLLAAWLWARFGSRG